jgi:hypothetical protein
LVVYLSRHNKHGESRDGVVGVYPASTGFEIWSYLGSKRRLYIRSTKGDSQPKNVDLIFHGVSYIDLLTIFWGLEIVPPTEQEIQRATEIVGMELHPDWIHILRSRERRSMVVAETMSIEENDRELHDLPFPDPWLR